MNNRNKLYEDAAKYDGGNAKLIKLFDRYSVPYELSSKKPTIRVAVRTTVGPRVDFRGLGSYNRLRKTRYWQLLLTIC